LIKFYDFPQHVFNFNEDKRNAMNGDSDKVKDEDNYKDTDNFPSLICQTQ
jgi:hypothetical protein